MNASGHSDKPDHPIEPIEMVPLEHDEDPSADQDGKEVVDAVEVFRSQLQGQEEDIQQGFRLRDVLEEELEGILVEDIKVPAGLEGKEVFRISIKDKEKWLSPGNLDVLAKHFGEDLWNIFVDRENPPPFRSYDPEFMEAFKQDFLMEGDIANAD